MPELPEVETIKRGLNKFCVQKRIKRVEIRCNKSFIGPKEVVEGAKIVELRRFGKALIFDLDNGVSMMVHLRMTGQLVWDSSLEEESQREETRMKFEMEVNPISNLDNNTIGGKA